MRVLYNATFARVGGGLSYCRAQISGLAEASDLSITVLTSPWNYEHFQKTLPRSVRLVAVKVPNAAIRFGWEQVVLPFMARGYDALLAPGNFCSIISPVPQVVVLQNPNYVGAGRRLPQNRFWRRRAKIWFSHVSMRRADLVVSISESLAAAIRSEVDLAHIKLVVITSGAPPARSFDGAGPADVVAVVEHLVGSMPYLLSVANDYPHKRLGDLARLVAQGLGPDLLDHVVLVGDIAEPRQQELRALAGSARGALVFLGAVTDPDTVTALYRGATAAVSVSELEAWPLTLHEAGSQGTPLVVSDIPPHRELAGDRAHYFPVGDIDALSEQLDRVAAGPPSEPWSLERTWEDHGRDLAKALHDLGR